MSLYFLLGTLSSDGQRLVYEDADLFLKATNSISIAGATVLGRYGVLGRYDYVIMVDARDNETVARMSVELGIRTGLHIETLPAIAIGFMADQNPNDPKAQPESIQLQPGQGATT